ncbi:urease subunit beta [Haloactinomyces albus]|uniref:Urease subunit beta n=1 Tax=Haloactinomyces albus TaxID=1352928 RepID=A0AAE4CNL8_9ACTN|nr:urease subunit beta [Haloactinomyces albus]MDR7303611.1 urease subunit beta [Haloactinomyces albus]
MIPGEVRVRESPLTLNSGRERRSLVVVNDGDRPIQIGSHLHFPDANPALSFDRDAVQGFRLDAPAGTSVRFEPGVSRTVELVALGGNQHVPGLRIRERSMPAHAREPRTIVPFGTPGAEPAHPVTASPPARARVTDEALHDDSTGQSDQPQREEGQ